MKRLLLSGIFTCFTICLFAKDSTNAKFYFSFSGAFWNHLAINSVIKNSGGTPFHLFAPEMGVGYCIQNNNYQGEIGIKFIFSKKNNETIPYKYQYGVVHLALRYNLLKLWNRKIYGGVDFEYIPHDITFYPQNNTIDLRNIDPKTQVGTIKMNNHSILLGPSILIENVLAYPDLKISFAMSYQFNISNSEWKAENAVILHSPIEDGHKLTLSFLICPFQN